MRKVLLRFVFDQVWDFRSAGNELLVGAGWLILFWLVAVACAFGVLFLRSRNLKESASSAGFWLIVPAVLTVLAVLKPEIDPVRSGIPLFGYGLMMFLGFSSAAWLAARRITTIGYPSEVIWDMMMWALLPGLIGARLTYLIQYWDRVFAGRRGLEKLIATVALWDGGIVFYGGVFGGIAGILVYCSRRGISAIRVFDVLVPSLFVGEGFGRIGCFLYGCCYGRECSLPWAVRFPPDSLTFEKLVERGVVAADAEATIPLHPTQLYSSFMAFVLAGILAWYYRRRPFDGSVLALGWILYPINRFVLESLRDDEPGRLGLSLTFSQQTSIGLLLTGIAAMYYFSHRRSPHTTSNSGGQPERPSAH